MHCARSYRPTDSDVHGAPEWRERDMWSRSWNSTRTRLLMPRNGFVTIGDRLPDIVLPDLDGIDRSLSNEPGKKMLIFMWASW